MNFKKDGNLAHIGSTITENDIIYSGVTKEWLLEHGWTPIIENTSLELVPEELLIEHLRTKLLGDVEDFDLSSSVNGFFLNGSLMWLSKADRVGLVNAINAAKNLGQNTVTIGLNGSSYNVNCDIALLMMYTLELYALECYNVTLMHKNNILNSQSLRALLSYNITKNYPGKLSFNI